MSGVFQTAAHRGMSVHNSEGTWPPRDTMRSRARVTRETLTFFVGEWAIRSAACVATDRRRQRASQPKQEGEKPNLGQRREGGVDEATVTRIEQNNTHDAHAYGVSCTYARVEIAGVAENEECARVAPLNASVR